MTEEERFENAQKRVNALPSKPDTATLLRLYGLYKQGSAGDVTGKRPGALEFRNRAKFDAWSARQGLTRTEAVNQYVSLVDKLVDAAS